MMWLESKKTVVALFVPSVAAREYVPGSESSWYVVVKPPVLLDSEVQVGVVPSGCVRTIVMTASGENEIPEIVTRLSGA